MPAFIVNMFILIVVGFIGFDFVVIIIAFLILHAFVPVTAISGLIVFRRMRIAGLISETSQYKLSFCSFIPYLDFLIAFRALYLAYMDEEDSDNEFEHNEEMGDKKNDAIRRTTDERTPVFTDNSL